MTDKPQIRIRLFAQAREMFGRGEIQVDCAGAATVGALRAHLAKLHPDFVPLLERSAVAVNLEYAADTRPLSPDDDVALLPPVAGG